MTANNSMHPDDRAVRAFYPHGWDHVQSEFPVPLGKVVAGVGYESWNGPFASVKRDANGHAYEVWCAGIGETFNNAAQAVHHIRLLARYVSDLNPLR